VTFLPNNSRPTANPDGGCAGAGDQAPQALGAQPPDPPMVIRGTSTGNGDAGDRVSPLPDTPKSPKTKVDYVTVSCREDVGAIHRCLAEVFREAIARPAFEPSQGMRHFAHSLRITVGGVPAGLVLFGGATQRGRACVDISGTGCAFVMDWERAQRAFLALPDSVWRRGDIAADFFDGKVTHERVAAAHEAGKFIGRGRNPKLCQILPSDPDEPRTIYVGKRGGDTFGRFYEKGKKVYWESRSKQLRKLAGSPDVVLIKESDASDAKAYSLGKWYRAELELRAKNRPLPSDWITRRDEYFTGAYPFLEELLPEVNPEVMLRPRDQGILAIERAFEVIKHQWGKTLYTGLSHCGGDYVALFRKILGKDHSPRLVAAGALIALGEVGDEDAQPH